MLKGRSLPRTIRSAQIAYRRLGQALKMIEGITAVRPPDMPAATAQRLNGRYMGLFNMLTPAQKKIVRKIRHGNGGVRAAIRWIARNHPEKIAS